MAKYEVKDIHLTKRAKGELTNAATGGIDPKVFLSKIVLIKYFKNGTKYKNPLMACNDEKLDFGKTSNGYESYEKMETVINSNENINAYVTDKLGPILAKRTVQDAAKPNS